MAGNEKNSPFRDPSPGRYEMGGPSGGISHSLSRKHVRVANERGRERRHSELGADGAADKSGAGVESHGGAGAGSAGGAGEDRGRSLVRGDSIDMIDDSWAEDEWQRMMKI